MNLLTAIVQTCLRSAVLLAFTIFCIASPASAASDEHVKRILLVESYSSLDPWTAGTLNGFNQMMAKTGIPVHYDTFSLSVRFREEGKPMPYDIQALQRRLDGVDYDMVVAFNNDAANLFLQKQVVIPKGTPLLLEAFIGEISPEQQQEFNMTGVFSPFNPYKTIQFGLRLLPETDHIFLLTNATADGDELQRLFTRNHPELREKVTILSGRNYSTPEMLEKIKDAPANSMLVFHSWSSTRENLSNDSYVTLPLIRKIFPGLILGRYDTYLALGSCGGETAISENQGKEIAELAVRVFHGEPPSRIPFVTAHTHTLLDARAMQRLGIPPDRVPANVKIVNRTPDFLTRHRVELATGTGILLLLLFSSFLIQLIRRREQTKFRLLIRNLPSWILIIDRKNRILYAHLPNPEAGWINDSTTNLEQLPPGQTRRHVLETVQKAFQDDAGVILDIERNGKFRHDVYQRFPRKNPFRREIVMCVSTDMTELHVAHQNAAQLAERFRLTLNSIGDGVIATDCDENITLLNPVAEALTGYSREEAATMKLNDIFHIVSYIDGQKVPSPLSRAIAEGRAVELANHTDLIARDGSRRHIADCASPIRDKAGKITGGVLVFRDVTGEYEKRDQLRMNTEVLKTIEKIARISYFRCSENGKTIQTPSPEYWPQRNGHGIPPEEWIHPKDREQFLTEWRNLLSGKCDSLALSYSADTPSRYFYLQAERSVSKDTGSVEYYGVIQDITTSRESEKQIRDNHQLLKNIIDNLPGYIFVKSADDDFHYIMCNSRFAEMVGRDCAQVIGRQDTELFLLDRAAVKRFREDDRLIVSTREKRSFRERVTVTGNREIMVQTVKTPFIQEDGTTLLLGMSIDVTREYELEQQQKETIKQLDHASRCEKIINQSLSMITVEQDLDRAVNEMLRIIGENANADRAYIFLNDTEDGRYLSNRYEWVRTGVAPQKDNRQQIDMEQFPEWRSSLACNRDIIVYDADCPPEKIQEELQALLLAQKVRSLLISGIWKDDCLLGFVGLDYTRERYEFAENTIHMVKSIANLFLLARERSMQMEQLAESAMLPKQIIDNISIPLAIIDMEFHFQAVNPSFLQLAGKTWEEVQRCKCHDILCENTEPPAWCILVKEGNSLMANSRHFKWADRSFIVHTQPIYDSKRGVRYALKSFVDITEINRQKEELQKAMNQAMAANRAKSFFLATMSHELRTPLNAVIGFSELLQSDGIDRSEQLEYLQSINYAGTALLGLINDVLDLSKLEADQMTISPAKTTMTPLLEELIAVFQLKARQKNLRLRMKNAITCLIYVDHQRLRQILLNLIGNAIKFTQHGGITVQADFSTNADGKTGTLSIQVIDTGIGIPKNQIEQIFAPFYQADNNRDSHAYEGTGLGLAISIRLAQKMGGMLAVASKPGEGSTFTLTLNDIRYETISEAEKPIPPPLAPAPLSHRLRILLVDDVPMNLKVLQTMLRKINAESVCADSGAQALDILECDQNFDFILTDLWMPEMNGEQLAGHIRCRKELQTIVIVAVTADTEAVNNFAMHNFDNILSKPVTLEKLRELLLNNSGKMPTAP